MKINSSSLEKFRPDWDHITNNKDDIYSIRCKW